MIIQAKTDENIIDFSKMMTLINSALINEQEVLRFAPGSVLEVNSFQGQLIINLLDDHGLLSDGNITVRIKE